MSTQLQQVIKELMVEGQPTLFPQNSLFLLLFWFNAQVISDLECIV